jgi:hypothetical protein
VLAGDHYTIFEPRNLPQVVAAVTGHLARGTRPG